MKYRDLATRIRWEIKEDHQWPPGAQLPTHRELARRYKTTQTTVFRAIAHLTTEGTLATVQGRGTYVATGTAPLTCTADFIERHVRELAAGNVPVGTARSLSDDFRVSLSTTRRVLRDLRAEGLIRRLPDKASHGMHVPTGWECPT